LFLGQAISGIGRKKGQEECPHLPVCGGATSKNQSLYKRKDSSPERRKGWFSSNYIEGKGVCRGLLGGGGGRLGRAADVGRLFIRIKGWVEGPPRLSNVES